MSTYTHRTIIVPAAFQALAQGLCEAAAEGNAGKGMFVRALAPTPAGPATHYISAGSIDEVFATILPETVVETEDGEDEEPVTVVSRTGGMPEQVVAIASQAGVPISLSVVQALYAAIDVSAQGPMQAMARMGLVFVRDDELLLAVVQ